MAKRGKRKPNEKQAFVNNVTRRLVKNPQSFLHLKSYNDAKRWMRGTNGCIGKYVDNGHSFLDILTRSLQQAGDSRLTTKFHRIQAEHRTQKAAQKSGRRSTHGSTSSSSSPSTIFSGHSLPSFSSLLSQWASSTSSFSSSDSPRLSSSSSSSSSASPGLPSLSSSAPFHTDVYYGKTDNETGYKEYTCVVIQMCGGRKTPDHCPREGLYFPNVGSKYKILNEVPMNRLKEVCGNDFPHVTGFVSSPFRERVLNYCKQNPGTKSGFNYSLFPHAMRWKLEQLEFPLHLFPFFIIQFSDYILISQLIEKEVLLKKTSQRNREGIIS